MSKNKAIFGFGIIMCLLLFLAGCNNNLDIKESSISTQSTDSSTNTNLNPNEICVGLAEDLDEQLTQLGLQSFSCELKNSLCTCVPQGVDDVEIVTNFNTGSTLAYIKDQEPFLLVKPESNFRWEYSERDGFQFYFTVEEYLSPFSRTNGDAVIVDSGSTRYGYGEDNTLRIRACSSTSDTIDYCISSRGLKNRGYSDALVDIYVPVNAQWDLRLEGSHPISNIKEQTEAKKVLKFIEYIPPINDYGFVDMKYVDSSWCWVKTDKSEYGDSKPECEKVVNLIKEKVKAKMDKEKPIMERKACFINCENRLRKEQLGIEIKPEEEQYCSSDCCPSFMKDEDDYLKYLETAYPVYGDDEARYLQCSEKLLDEFLQSK